MTDLDDHDDRTSFVDEYADLIENNHEIFLDDCIERTADFLAHTRGILWLKTLPFKESIPERLSFDKEKKSKCNDQATSMHHFIIEKCAPLHPSVFTNSVLENWRVWFDEQHAMWTDSPQFFRTLLPFAWPSAKETRQLNNPLPIIEASERPEAAPGMEIITHDSSMHAWNILKDRTCCKEAKAALESRCKISAGSCDRESLYFPMA